MAFSECAAEDETLYSRWNPNSLGQNQIRGGSLHVRNSMAKKSTKEGLVFVVATSHYVSGNCSHCNCAPVNAAKAPPVLEQLVLISTCRTLLAFLLNSLSFHSIYCANKHLVRRGKQNRLVS